MGQAKQQGTYEERRTLAITKLIRQEQMHREIAKRRPSPKLSTAATIIMTSSLFFAVPIKGK